jgi:prepilin signal peptidase PulO-like enzyme (type II secretory pathway)
VELLMGVLFLLTALFHFPFSPLLADQLPVLSLGLYLFVTAALAIITVYDLLYMEIPDEVSLPTIGILFLSTLLWGFPVAFTDGLLGAGIILAFFGAQILVSRGRWLGMGDLRIGAIMGLLLGWQLGLLALFASYVFGSVIVLLLLLGKKRYSLNSEIPFAPFLVLGTLFAWYVGPSVLSWYINGLLGY